MPCNRPHLPSQPRPHRSAANRRHRAAAILAALAFSLTAGLHAQPPVPQAAPRSELTASNDFRSVFISDPTYGKDPFFPQSKRRVAQIPVQPVLTNAPVVDLGSDAVFELFQLKGVSTAAERKLALINQYTFAEGEEQDCKVADQIIRVRCVKIEERSALISIKGRKKELALREGI